MNAIQPWFEKLSRSSGMDETASVLAQAVGETTRAESAGIFLLDSTRTNLLFFASWSAEAGPVLERKQHLPAWNLEDPLWLALQQGKAIITDRQMGIQPPPSLAMLENGKTQPGALLAAYPLLAWNNAAIGGAVLTLGPNAPAPGNGAELLCAYGALILAFFEQKEHDRVCITSLHENLTRLEDSSGSLGEAVVSSLLIGKSPAMQKVREQILQVAPYAMSVLITGETGTGKELVATAIHAASPRSRAPFVKINCGALPPQLLESELFGHKKGAFSGADADHLGLLRSAEGGTVLLDEIGDMPMELQVKLLRVLQDHEVRPVGEVHSYPVDIRVIAATNKEMEHAIKDGSFRKDLYYRLATCKVHLPALRERREDVPLLAMFFLDKYRKIYAAENITVSHNGMMELCSFEYGGNVRELAAIIENAVITKDKNENIITIHPDMIKTGQGRKGDMTLNEQLQSYEWAIISSAMECYDNNTTKAARALGIPRTSLLSKIRRGKRV